MAKFWQKNGITSVILRVFIPDTTSVIGGGKTGLTFASAGLIISTIADTEPTATSYTQAGSTIETITTLGTFAAPTATKCRFKEVDSVNFPGVYEIQIADARWAVSNARSLLVSLPYVVGLGSGYVRAEVQLTAFDPQTATQSVNVTQWLGQAVAAAVNGIPKVDLTYMLGTLFTEGAAGRLVAGIKQFFNVATPTSTMNEITLVDTTTNLTNAPPPSTDPLLSLVPGAYAVGTAGYDIGQIPAIKAKTDLITSGSVTIANPVNPASLALTLYSNVDYLPTSGAALPTWTSADWTVYGLATAASVILYYADTNSTVDTALGTMVVDSATSIHLTATAAQVFAVPLGENVVGYKIIAVLDVAHGSVEVQLANASLSHLNYVLYADKSTPNTTP